MGLRMSYDFRVAVKVFINGQFSLLAQAMTWWIYKQHNIVLFKIYETHQRVVSFISKSCGGRVIDEYIAGQCVVKKILPGDIVLADRRFNIIETLKVGLLQECLKLLAFTRGKCLPKMWRAPETLPIFWKYFCFSTLPVNILMKLYINDSLLCLNSIVPS